MSAPIATTTSIKDFIQSALTQIKESLPDDARIDGIINMKITTIVQREKGGGIDLKVLDWGADASTSQTQEITIPIRILTDTGMMLEKTMKAEFESRIAKAETEKKLEELKASKIGVPSVRASSSSSP